MRHHEIDTESLIEWHNEKYVEFASSTREKKRLVATLNGGYEVYHNGKLVYEGIQASDAVKAYNNITQA
jgi:hypothetical protein